jgi:NAD(P)-dependent dehydrogenase (short-subunit alcohol dehydrogenase family)
MARFDGRAVAVTGAAGQIGGACAQAFAREGARVAAIDRDTPEASDAITPVRADLSQPAELERAFAEAERAVGPIDVLVQSAAAHGRVPFLEITPENIDAVYAINVRALILGARAAAASMVARGAADGVIVNLTSVSGMVGEGGSIAYEASKGAVTMATKGMAVSLAPHGIRVVAVGPGSMVKFQEVDEVREPADVDDYERRRIPLARLGRPEEIADSVLFMASPAARYVTGTVLYVDGGSLAAW